MERGSRERLEMERIKLESKMIAKDEKERKENREGFRFILEILAKK